MGQSEASLHRRRAIGANNRAWELIESKSLSAAEYPTLICSAVAAQWHWQRADADPHSVRHLRAMHLLVFAMARIGRCCEAAEVAGGLAAAQALVTVGLTPFDRAMTLASQACSAGTPPGSALQAAIGSLDADERRVITALLARP